MQAPAEPSLPWLRSAVCPPSQSHAALHAHQQSTQGCHQTCTAKQQTSEALCCSQVQCHAQYSARAASVPITACYPQACHSLAHLLPHILRVHCHVLYKYSAEVLQRAEVLPRADSRVEVDALGECCCNFWCCHHCCQGQTIANALGHCHNVGLNALVLEAPKVAAGAAEARLNLVSYAHTSVCTYDLSGTGFACRKSSRGAHTEQSGCKACMHQLRMFMLSY